MPLDDYGALLRSGAAAVPDYTAQEAQRQLLALRKKELNAQIDKAQRQIDEKQSFDADISTLLTNPTSEGYARMIAKHPDFATQIKQSHDILDAGRQQADLTQMAEVYSAAANGRHDLAAQLMKRRVDADKAGDGQADPTDEAILAALESNDPVQQKAALGMMGLGLSAITGPDKFHQTLGQLTDSTGPQLMPVGAGTVVIDKNNPAGGAVFESPYRPETITDPGTGQIFRLVPKTGAGSSRIVAGDQPGPADPSHIWDSFIAPHEGGYAEKDGNGAPVNFGINQGANPDVDVKSLTPEKAKALFLERYWKPSGAESLPAPLAAVHADTYYISPSRAQDFLQRSGGDPNKYMTMREDWMKDLVARDPTKYGRFDKAWTQRNADLRQFSTRNAGGTANAPTKVRSKQEYDRLPNGAQYIAPDGSLRVKG